MIDNVYFRAWLANTVHAISGIWAYDWQGSQRKRSLTFLEIRAAACQAISHEGKGVFWADSEKSSPTLH